MKRILLTAGAALTLAVTLAGCSAPGSEARDLAERWLSGEASVQCNAASTWSAWELGSAKSLRTIEGSERWAIEISGTRSMAPEAGGHLLVDLREDEGSCVRWYEWPK